MIIASTMHVVSRFIPNVRPNYWVMFLRFMDFHFGIGDI